MVEKWFMKEKRSEYPSITFLKNDEIAIAWFIYIYIYNFLIGRPELQAI